MVTAAVTALIAALTMPLLADAAAAEPVHAQAWTDGACATAAGVTVVIDFGDLGGGVHVRCAPGAVSSGFDALNKVGVEFRTAIRQPGVLCRIAGQPADDPCIDTSPASAYWSYWLAPRGGAWCYSNWGAGNRVPPQGSVEGWSFSRGQTSSNVPPPGLAPPALAGATAPALAASDCDPKPSAPKAPVGTDSSANATTAPNTTAKAPVTAVPNGPNGSNGSNGSINSPAAANTAPNAAPSANSAGTARGATTPPAPPGSDSGPGAQTPAMAEPNPVAEVEAQVAAETTVPAEDSNGSTDPTDSTSPPDSTGSDDNDDRAAGAPIELSAGTDRGSPVGVAVGGSLIAAMGLVALVLRKRGRAH